MLITTNKLLNTGFYKFTNCSINFIKFYKIPFFQKSHNYHLVPDSRWPVLFVLSLFCFIFCFASWVNPLDSFTTNYVVVFLLYNFYLIFLSLKNWVLDMLEESRNIHIYTKAVENNFMLSILTFILSEVLLFFCFLWAFFNASLSPSIFLGLVWPSCGVFVLNPWTLPFINTVLLLTSGLTVNSAYYTLKGLYNFNKDIYTYQKNFNLNLKIQVLKKDKDSILSMSLSLKKFKLLLMLFSQTFIVFKTHIVKSRTYKHQSYKFLILQFYLFLNIYFFLNQNFFKLSLFFIQTKGNIIFKALPNLYVYANFLRYVKIISIKRYYKLFRIYKQFFFTYILGFVFLVIQIYEYSSASYSMSDNIFGATFYSLTGLHGGHGAPSNCYYAGV